MIIRGQQSGWVAGAAVDVVGVPAAGDRRGPSCAPTDERCPWLRPRQSFDFIRGMPPNTNVIHNQTGLRVH
jgi:hypothetical protein